MKVAPASTRHRAEDRDRPESGAAGAPVRPARRDHRDPATGTAAAVRSNPTRKSSGVASRPRIGALLIQSAWPSILLQREGKEERSDDRDEAVAAATARRRGASAEGSPLRAARGTRRSNASPAPVLKPKPSRRRGLAVWALASALALVTHYFAAFLISAGGGDPAALGIQTAGRGPGDRLRRGGLGIPPAPSHCDKG